MFFCRLEPDVEVDAGGAGLLCGRPDREHRVLAHHRGAQQGLPHSHQVTPVFAKYLEKPCCATHRWVTELCKVSHQLLPDPNKFLILRGIDGGKIAPTELEKIHRVVRVPDAPIDFSRFRIPSEKLQKYVSKNDKTVLLTGAKDAEP